MNCRKERSFFFIETVQQIHQMPLPFPTTILWKEIKTILKASSREKIVSSFFCRLFSSDSSQPISPQLIHQCNKTGGDFRYSEFIFYLFNNLCCLTPHLATSDLASNWDKTTSVFTQQKLETHKTRKSS